LNNKKKGNNLSMNIHYYLILVKYYSSFEVI